MILLLIFHKLLTIRSNDQTISTCIETLLLSKQSIENSGQSERSKSSWTCGLERSPCPKQSLENSGQSERSKSSWTCGLERSPCSGQVKALWVGISAAPGFVMPLLNEQ